MDVSKTVLLVIALLRNLVSHKFVNIEKKRKKHDKI